MSLSIPTSLPEVVIRPENIEEAKLHQLRQATGVLSRLYSQQGFVSDQDLKEMGRLLWDSISEEEAKQKIEIYVSQIPLAIIVETNLPERMNFFWETLYHPKLGFLGQNSQFTLSRRFPGFSTDYPPLEVAPLRVLLFTSLPDDLSKEERLAVEEEQAVVQIALAKMEQEGRVHLWMPHDGRFETFQKFLKDHQPHLVYLSGHGQFRDDPVAQKSYGTFLFENTYGKKVEITEDELAGCFVQTGTQALVLSACLSAKGGSKEAGNGLIYRLSRQGIAHVIGMRESIADSAGIEFSDAFFRALSDGKNISEALQSARRKLGDPAKSEIPNNHANSAANLPRPGQWCLPVLIGSDPRRNLTEPGCVFEPEPPPNLLQRPFEENLGLPDRFIGRRREFRKLYDLTKEENSGFGILITGAGGMGKTALAGKWVSELQNKRYSVFAYSARPENNFSAFKSDVVIALEKDMLEEYQLKSLHIEEEAQKIELLLRFLLRQNENKLLLFFDNIRVGARPFFFATDR